jgi:RNA polymerase sigma-70 factor (ECF subfamily)
LTLKCKRLKQVNQSMYSRSNNFAIYTDEELMQFVCDGKEQAFEMIYLRYGKNLLNYYHKMLNYDVEKAKDALQDLFLKIAEHPEKFDKTQNFKTWLYTIASNACKNYYRHISVVVKAHEEISYLNETNVSSGEKHFKIDKNNFLNELNGILETLPFEKKEAFLLRYLEDKSINEISQIQGIAEGTVKSRIHYTLKLLETQLIAFKP